MAQMQLFLLRFLEIGLGVTFFLLGQSSSGDIMTGNSSLIDGQTLISAGSVFQLGFFSPINDSANAYVGIWYYNLPPRESKVVVWVANRNRAVNTSMASLNLTSDGNLILLEEGTKVWSTGTSAELNSARLQLLDSGNLVLTDGSSRTLWQSFDHACDTLLPGMKLGFDYRTNTSWQLVTWMSDTDPSPGKYIVRMETYDVPDIVTLNVNGSVKLARTGPWNEKWFVVLPTLGRNLNFTYVSNQNETYYMNEYETRSAELTQTVADANGTHATRSFVEGEWRVLLSFPRDDCDYYNHCGGNSVCTKGYYSSSCSCLEGFVENESVVGCARTEPLSCSSNQFGKEPSVKLPDTENATSRGEISLDMCKKLCSDDCSCVAYAVINGPHGCITWRGEMLDLRNYPDGGDDLYIRLPESSTPNCKKLVLAIVIPVSLGIFLLCCLGVIVRRKKNRASICRLQLQFPNVQKGSISTLEVLPSYDLRTIKTATNDFSEGNKLGEGGFGVVYEGELEDGQKIAVKKLSRYSSQGPDEFQNELSLIAKLQHRNFVRLLGCCIEADERLMILEYMENKSLDQFIYDKTKSSLLNWQKRFDIIIGIARGLLYLHQDSRLRIIHRDLKPSNILLDKDMNPKISDFGIARIFKGDNALENATTRLVGTFKFIIETNIQALDCSGYMAPEYLSRGVFSFKSDVFSFGVIVLEIISGKKNRVFSETDTSLNLLGYTYKLWEEERSLEIVDDTLNQSYSTEEVLRCIQTSLLCVQNNSKDRSTMVEVVTMLTSEDQLHTPIMQSVITSTSNEEGFTINEISLSLVGR